MATNPTIIVNAYFDGASNPPVDISSYGRDGVGFQMDRGTQSIEATGFVADTGTLSLNLDNRARTFDPNYALGPYFGKLVPGVPVALEVQYAIGLSVGTYPLFYGFVDDWEQRYGNAGDDPICALRASDGGARIAQAQVTLSRPFESPGARIAAIFAEIDTTGVFAGVVDTGVSTMFPMSRGTVTASSAIVEATQVEWGNFFFSASGRGTFFDRRSLYNQVASNTPQATFSDMSGLKYTAVTMVRPPIVNDCTVVWNDRGAQVNVQDPASQALAWGKQSLNLSLPFGYAALASDYAHWLVVRYAYPGTVFGSVTFKPRADPDNLFPQAFQRELCDMISVTRSPTVNGVASAPITGNCWIRGISHSYQNRDWTTTYTLQDASWTSNIFRLNSSLLNSTDFLAF